MVRKQKGDLGRGGEQDRGKGSEAPKEGMGEVDTVRTHEVPERNCP